MKDLLLTVWSWLAALKMWWRFKTDGEQYKVSQQWFSLGDKKTPEQVYAEVQDFVKDVVGLSPRPYGHGAYGLVFGAIWPPEENPARTDRWQVIFTYAERVDIYRQLAERMAGWPEPPLGIMVKVLPYGPLFLG